MADLPTPQSYDQILANMLSSYASSLGIDDFNVGSAVTSFFEVVALTTARASGDVFQILRDFSIDRATGDALQRLAIEDGVIPITASPATGTVSVIDSSFTKISTKIYAGFNSPNIGSTTINASDASLFPATGAIYIGRGTPDIEGPIAYGSITPPGSPGGFYVINLSAPTTKYHNVGETIILAQGGTRSIPANTIVYSQAVGATSNTQYSTTAQAIILDGETEVDNVPISALIPGSAGNVPIGTINQFASPPFSGATVNNPLPLVNGADSETDQQLRVRIKAQLASIGLGTATAIENAVVGATATTPNGAPDTIASASILSTTTNATLYIDDGTGYEETFQGVGIESIVDSALGGEQFFQLTTGGTQAPVAKAFLLSTLAAPFDLIGGDTLAIVVGNTTYQHVFANSDFLSPGGATAYEVTASVNADSSLGFEALTSGGGTYVLFRAKAESFDSLQTTTPNTTGRNAAVQLGLPSSEVQTLRLYKNNIPLSKDGSPAFILTQDQQYWSSLISNGATLVLSVDGTAPITYTFFDSDFIATGLYTSVSSSNSLASWVEVFNNKLTGITASIVGTQIEITSNLGEENRASVIIDPASTLVTDGMFSSSIGLSSTGQTSDFTLDRNTAQFELVVPLVPGDQLSAGSLNTQARIQSAEIPASSVTLSANGYIWILIDNPGTIIPTGVLGNTFLSVSTPSTNVVRYTSTVSMAFSNVQPGDYVIIWSPQLNVANQIEGRVYAVSGTTLDILITPAEWAAIVPQTNVLFSEGFVVLRSTLAPQKFKIAAGTYTLDELVQTLQPQTPSLVFSVLNEEYLVVSTVTKDITGSLLIVTADSQGILLNFMNGASSVSQTSLIAYYDSQYKEASFPLFVQAMFASGTSANPIDSFITSFVSSINFSSRDPNELISILSPYEIDSIFTTTATVTAGSNQLTSVVSTSGVSDGYTIVGAGIPLGTTVVSFSGTTISMSANATANGSSVSISFNSPSEDAQPQGEYVQESSISGTTINIVNESDIRRLRGPNVDRFFIASPLDFGNQDTAIVVADNNPSSETFTLPFYRDALTNTSLAVNASNFNAYDVDSSPTANFVTAFGSTFSFANYKVLMQAKRVLKPSPSMTAILYRSVPWGRSGQYINVGYVYPSSANSALNSTVNVGSTVDIRIILASGSTISTSIDYSTQWNVTITPNTPTTGIDQVTYTYAANQYVFTISPGNATVGATYTNNGQTFTVVATVADSTTIIMSGAVAPFTYGALTKTSGTGDSTIVFSSFYGPGTSPNLVLSGGEYVNISTRSGFNVANTGTFRVSTQSGFAPTSTSFTVQVPSGTAFAQDGALTTVNGSINFYSPSSTTAAQVQAYVTANLSQYITATLVNDGGYSGAGIIGLSTYEDSGFTYQSVYLEDGINWIAYSNLSNNTVIANGSTTMSSNILVDVYPISNVRIGAAVSGPGIQAGSVVSSISGNNIIISLPATATVAQTGFTIINTGTPQFVFKVPLAYPSDGPGNAWYAFNNGEKIKFIPTTMVQVQQLLSVLAVTGFTTAGTVDLVDRGTRLELATDTVGSAGAIQIVGGLANQYEVPVLDSAVRLDNTYMQIAANNIASQGILSDQWFRLQAATAQNKDTLISSNTSVTLFGNEPTVGQTTVQLSGKTLTQRYFGKPRNNIRSQGDTFRIEKQGALVCLSWNPNIGTNPMFVAPLSFNDSAGGTVSVSLVPNTDESQYTILTGNANFTTLSIGDLITVTGLNAANNGTFLVTGVSSNGKTIQVLNPNAVGQFPTGTFTFTGNANLGDTFTIGTTTLTTGGFAYLYSTISGTSTPVTIMATTVGPIGHSITLTFTGTNSISAAIITWNAANPSNTATLTAGDGTQVPTAGFSTLYEGTAPNGNVGIGGSQTATAENLASAINLIPGFTATVSGSVVTVYSTFSSSSIALAYTPISTTEVTTSGSFLAGTSFAAGNFSATSGVSEGDTFILSAPFNILNQGKFRVIREYNNAIWFENPNVVGEEVSLPYNPISLGFDSSTAFMVNATNNTLYLSWMGTGTQPTLGNANVGDIITLGSPFSGGNQGSFMVLDSGPAQQQITQFVMPAGSAFTPSAPGQYFTMWNAGNITHYYVWFNIGTNTDPAPGGLTGIQVPILSSDSAATVAAKAAIAIAAVSSSFTATSSSNILTVTTVGFNTTTLAANFNMPAPFTVTLIQTGQVTFLEAIDPFAVNQSSITSATIQLHRPQMQFYEYEATVPGDVFSITGSVLTLPNAGNYAVYRVLNQNAIIVTGTLASVMNVSLNGNENAVFIQEGVPYSGYKQVYLVAAEPGSPTQNDITLNTNAQYEKINQSASVELTSLNKIDYNTLVKNGLDSYSYNTGLVAEANRIVYGDPRDPLTYPGVGAAGADIFIRGPLVARIQVSIDIRLATGVPFAQTVNQVRSSVSSLINSNPVGQSIAISAIISVVNAIPGILAVSISSPAYSVNNDLIVLQPSQKAIIIDPTTDISVSQVGT